MTLSLKNYKGFEKRPYCNAHCPQAKATTVADTPEIRRLAENTRIQSQAKYHEDFEKSKGKGFTAIADDPETLRIKNTSKIISNVAYHGELERKKQMEEKRGLSGQEEAYNNNNNNTSKHQNRMQQHSDSDYKPQHQVSGYPAQSQYPVQNQQQVQQQQQIHLHQQHLQKQQQQHHNQHQLLKQQHQHQLQYAQDLKSQPIVNRQHPDAHLQQQQQQAAKLLQSQYPNIHPHQQQLIMRQQQQHQMMIQQQQRHSMDPSLGIQPSKQQPVANNHHQPQQILKHQMIPAQSMKYMAPMGEPVGHHASPTHFMGNHILNPSQLSGVTNGQRIEPSGGMVVGSQAPQHLIHGHHQGVPLMNGAPKQQHFVSAHPPRQVIQPGQMQPMAHHQMQRPHSQQPIKPQQMPRGVFRAMYDYVANDVDEVSFFENDILIDCVNVDGNWLIGKVARSGQTGMLPANYVTEFSC